MFRSCRLNLLLPLRFPLALVLGHFAVSIVAGQELNFTRDVKPILSDKCFACHGPDENQRATDFRLDDPASALDPELGLIQPGHPENSLLIERIQSSDPDLIMPPVDQVKQLTDREKNILQQWIQQGAQWEAHWAFRPIATIDRETLESGPWPTGDSNENNATGQINPIDALVLKSLQEQEIQPSPRADAQTLLRRLSFDLTGLPPDLDRQDQFAREIGQLGFEQAYQRQVDQLLALPAFGERMAVHWLDLVRYADTVGYHGDQPVSVSPYRDWVIQAFHENKPFDQFTREQLAGDLLPNATAEQKIASGYNRLGMMSAEGGVQPEEYLLKYAADRVRTTGTAWLGLTLGCAECHDHKFDPISTREFYEFSAFFADIKEQGLYAGSNSTGQWGTSMDVPSPELPTLLQPLEQERDALQVQFGSSAALDEMVARWEAELNQAGDWDVLTPVAVRSLAGAELKTLEDQSILVQGKKVDADTYAMEVDLPKETRALMLELIPDQRLPAGGPGRAGNGNLVLTEWVLLQGSHAQSASGPLISFQQAAQLAEDAVVTLKNSVATIEQANAPHPDGRWSANSAVDRDAHSPNVGWAILPQVNRHQQLRVQLEAPVSGRHTIVLLQNHGTQHTIGRFRLLASSDAEATLSPKLGLPEAVLANLQVPVAERNESQRQVLRQHLKDTGPQFADLRKQIQQVEQKIATVKKEHIRTTLITVSVPAREVRVLPRGNWMDRSGPVVGPGVPEVINHSGLPENPNRLDLANWLVAEENPLTARVFVNRLWRMYFGTGLSSVLDDLGSQGEFPSHPELLDYLAGQFREDWDVKKTIRQIVTSQTYQQSSQLRKDLKSVDPENRLLARQSRYRLDAEFIRDHCLAVSGLLVDEIGGRSVFPYQPAGLYRHLNFPTRKYQASQGEDQYRRGLYTHWQRQFLHPAMKTFDAPPREECTAARPRSSTPLAALLMLNDPSYVETARAWAQANLSDDRTTEERLDRMYRQGLSRPATAAEKQVLTQLLQEHRQYYLENPESAQQLISVGQPKDALPQAPTRQAELAAWTSVARTIMNLHEFISRR